MRIGTGLAVMMALTAAPVAAQDRAAAARSPSLQPLPLGTVTTSSVRLSNNLHLRIGVADAQAAPSTRIHSRLSGSMIDFYPLEGRGFHLSAGTRLFADRDLAAESARGARGLLARTRGPAGMPRLGQRRATPALTMGYTGEIAQDTSVGVEMGALKGRGYATVDEMAKGGGQGGRGGVNPMLNLVVGRRF